MIKKIYQAAFLFPILLLAFIILFRKSTLVYTTDIKISTNISAAKQVWKNHSFTKIENTSQFRTMLKDSLANDAIYKTLGRNQQSSLIDELSLFYNTYAGGDSSTFWTFHNPLNNATFNQTAIGALKLSLKSQQPPVTTEGLDDKQVADLFIKLSSQEDFKDGPRSFTMCSSCLRSVATDAFELFLHPKNRIPIKVGDIAVTKMNVGISESAWLMFIQPSPEEIIKTEGELTAITVTTICKEATKLEVEPLLLTVYWYPKKSIWLPYQIGQGTSRMDRAIIPF